MLTVSFFANAKNILVKNSDELKKANKESLPGDNIILQNGQWNNVTISLTCSGSLEKPITVKAQTKNFLHIPVFLMLKGLLQ
jgi:hypothetical protein